MQFNPMQAQNISQYVQIWKLWDSTVVTQFTSPKLHSLDMVPRETEFE